MVTAEDATVCVGKATTDVLLRHFVLKLILLFVNLQCLLYYRRVHFDRANLRLRIRASKEAILLWLNGSGSLPKRWIVSQGSPLRKSASLGDWIFDSKLMVDHLIHDQTFYLNEKHKKHLREEFSIPALKWRLTSYPLTMFKDAFD
ncbi:non-specific serine,threonine protein kinase [Sarracenia purpurea var. burkii]